MKEEKDSREEERESKREEGSKSGGLGGGYKRKRHQLNLSPRGRGYAQVPVHRWRYRSPG